MTVTIGADPELFLSRDGNPVSAIDRIKGSKDRPFPVMGGKGFAVQADNVAVEYNIPICNSANEFVLANTKMLGYLACFAEVQGTELDISPARVFSDQELDHPLAHIFGCEPDFNAWKLVTNPKPNCDNPNLRVAGGHIHIGMEGKVTNIKKIALIKALDYYLGIPLAILEGHNERTKLYGKPGAMRMKPYGVEWRTPSNIWLTSPQLMREVGVIVQKLSEAVLAGISDYSKLTHGYDKVEKAFNDRKFIDEHHMTMCLKLWSDGPLSRKLAASLDAPTEVSNAKVDSKKSKSSVARAAEAYAQIMQEQALNLHSWYTTTATASTTPGL